MPSATKKAFFGGCVFEVCENVYEPAEDSFLFAENLRIAKGERVLDMGTGCGILGIVAAQTAGEVFAVDVNPYAVPCASKNAFLNCVRKKMVLLRADLFTAFGDTTGFDVILFNAPYLPAEESEADSWLGRAWAGGETGRQVIDRFLSQSPRHLKQKGRILLMQSTLADVKETQRQFAERQMVARVVASLSLPFFETLTLLEAKFDL